jgi:hypothetical protein
MAMSPSTQAGLKSAREMALILGAFATAKMLVTGVTLTAFAIVGCAVVGGAIGGFAGGWLIYKLTRPRGNHAGISSSTPSGP